MFVNKLASENTARMASSLERVNKVWHEDNFALFQTLINTFSFMNIMKIICSNKAFLWYKFRQLNYETSTESQCVKNMKLLKIVSSVCACIWRDASAVVLHHSRV